MEITTTEGVAAMSAPIRTLTVGELHARLTAALAAGVGPDTAVVVDLEDDGSWMTLDADKVVNPTDTIYATWTGDDAPEYIWFTLVGSGEYADSRFTAGYAPEIPAPITESVV